MSIQRTITFEHVVTKKDNKDYLKKVEADLNDHRTFLDQEVKTLNGLRSTFADQRKFNSRALKQDAEQRKNEFGQGRRQLDDKLYSIEKWKTDLETDRDPRDVEDYQEKVKVQEETLAEVQGKNKEYIQT